MASVGYLELVSSVEAGASVDGHFRKAPSSTTVAKWWADLSMMSGSPLPQYYAASPLESALMPSGLTRGLFRGDDVAPARKHLLSIMTMVTSNNTRGTYYLCDYLLYYPFIDGDVLDEQLMTQVAPLPDRYPDGGAQVIAVAQAPTVGGGSFVFGYVNQDGNAAVSPTQFCSTAVCNIASLVTGQSAVAGGNPFLTLASGDSSVREITSVTMLGATGGLFALVLVKPLATHVNRDALSPAESIYLGQRSPGVLIPDGAYLNFVFAPAGAVAATFLTGLLRFGWV